MSEKDKNNSLYIYDEIQRDEMQKALSFELEHKCLRMWYLLNCIITLVAAFIIEVAETPLSAPAIILCYYGIMLFCLAIYDIRASEKGVLDSLPQYQTGMKGWRYIIATLQIIIPMGALVNYITGVKMDAPYHPVFFSVFFAFSFGYDIISYICVKRNKKVMDNSADEDENDE